MQFKKLSIRTLNQHSKRSLNKVLYIHTYISYQLSADVKVGFFFVTAEQSALDREKQSDELYSRGEPYERCEPSPK